METLNVCMMPTEYVVIYLKFVGVTCVEVEVLWVIN